MNVIISEDRKEFKIRSSNEKILGVIFITEEHKCKNLYCKLLLKYLNRKIIKKLQDHIKINDLNKIIISYLFNECINEFLAMEHFLRIKSNSK